MAKTESKDQFAFEAETQRDSAGKAQYRRRDQARREREVLLRRMEVTPEQEKLLAPLEDLLDRYCLEVPLNIQWYEAARLKAFARLLFFNSLILIVAVVAVVVTGLLLWNGAPGKGGLSLAELSVAIAAILGAVQVLAAANDHKARAGIFWKAAADLKEQLYSFVESWRGKVLVDGKVAPDFETMLRLELKAARKIARDERTEFFSTYRSTHELVGIAGATFDVVRGRRQEVLTARRELADLQAREASDIAARILRARQAISEAAANVAAVKYRLDELIRLRELGLGNVTDDLLAQTQQELVRAESEKLRAEALLQAILRDDRPARTTA